MVGEHNGERRRTAVEFPGEDGSLLALTPFEVDATLPSVRARVEFRLGQFTGVTDAWFEISAIESFAAALRELERRRQGVASLCALSPGECEVRLESYDSAGHVVLHLQLAKANWAGRGREYRPTKLAGSFEIDAGLLAALPPQAEQLKSVAAR
jgi:hypothetical protein